MRKTLTIFFAFFAMLVMAQVGDADYSRLGQQAKVSRDSVPAVLREIIEREQALRHTDRVEAAVLETLLSMQTTDSVAREYHRLALSDLDALAQARAKDYPKMVHRMSMGKYFNDDMLSVIGFELGEYDLLHDYYEHHGRREAALLCALESLRQRGDGGARKMEGSTYIASLDSLMRVYGDLDLAGEIAIERYAFMDMARDVTSADKVSYLENILNRYKKYERINILRNAYNGLTDPMVRMESFSDLLTSRDSILLQFTHRNVSDATLRIYRTNMRNDEQDFDVDDTELDKNGYKEFRKTHKCKELSNLRQKMVFGEETLRYTQNETVRVAPLPVGIYIVEIATSSKPKMEPLRHLLFISNIRPLITPLPDEDRIITAVDALTGQPLTTATLQYVEEGEEDEKVTAIAADQHGQVYLKDADNDCILFTKDDHALPTFNPEERSDFYDMIGEDEEQVVGELMTDRSVYRPGQTVHLALVAYTQERCTTQVLPNQSFIVTVQNPQWKEIDSLSLTTDAFGTAHIDYRLPARLPLGRYTLRIDKKRSHIKQDLHGTTSQTLRVEEYKRPTFKVSLDKSNDVVRIGDTLHLNGRAQTITGDPLRGATVTWSAFIRDIRKWRVLRDECDTLMTDHEGRFTITLPIVSQERYPIDDDIYRTEIHAYVTDAAGETHDVTENYQFTKRGIALSSNVQGKLIERRDLENFTFALKATNFCGNKVDLPLQYLLDDQPGQGSTFTAPQLGTGLHTLVVTHEGDTLRQTFIVYDRKATRPCVTTSDWFDVSGSTFDAEGKEPCSVWIGTSERDVTIHYYVFTADSLLSQGVLHLSDSIARQDYTYREDYGDGITVLYIWYSNGWYHQETAQFELAKPDKKLKAQWSTFRDKLMPGQQEEWRLKLTHQDGRPADARVIATLYDKSLDELEHHRWSWDTRLIRRMAEVNNYPESYRMDAADYVHSKRAKEEELIMSWLNFGIGNYGQGVPVSGHVSDADGEALIGASVMVTGTRIGTVTDINGNYELTAPAGSRISFAYVGYKTKTLHVISHTINVIMEEDANALEEVVVVGYGVQNKSLLTGSVAGVRFTEPVIKRDAKLQDNSQPLYIVDGEIVDDISSIPSASIIEMTTLSGNDATGIYGARAAGGVIVITTNQGKQATSPNMPLNVAMRENLSETAFFYPTLRTDGTGEVSIAFTLPESITTWQFLGSAHTRDMDHTIVEATTTARQDLMVQPNMPRYLRSGDKATLTARVSNTSNKTLKGTGVLQLIDPEDDRIVYTSRQPFQVLADSVSSLTFTYTPSEQTPPLLTCKVAVMADGMSDGEQHYLPVLPSVEPQMNTFSFTMPGPTNSLIDVKQLFPAGSTDKRFTFEYTNNPAWLMIEALHEYAHPYDDCAICQAMALFSQDIAASLGSHEEINTAIQRWNEEQDSVTVLSPLERNDDLKNILHAETPWLMAAESEREQKQQLISLFNPDNQKKQHDKALNALRMLQNGDGSWSWFPGMEGSPYITHVVAELLVRSNALCGRHPETLPMLDEAFHYMATKGADLHYLYLCALDGRHPSDSLRREVRKELKALRREAKGNDISNIYSAAVKAIVLDAFNEKGADDLLDQIMNLTVTDHTLGRYFDSYLAPYSWLDYKIPTQVMVIEALERIRPDDEKKIAEMRQWLLQEKRSQYWVTPIQSANAIYAFLRGNMESLTAYPMPSITIDGESVDTETATGTLGYVKTTHPAKEASEINIIKHERHTSWGTVYAQYMQRGEDVKATGTDLQVHREIIAPHGGVLRVGDKVRVRITLTAKRDLDFVQVNDRRAACLEAVDPLSGYRNGYYVQNRDCTTQYFISMLSKGTHVIEKEFYVDRAGTYHSGSITAQCAYAPEFMGTEGSYELRVMSDE